MRMIAIEQVQNEIVNNLSALILQSAGAYQDECHQPSSSPDVMDYRLKFYKERTEKLREIRQQFEDIMAESSVMPT